jgi:hypothetical protein
MTNLTDDRVESGIKRVWRETSQRATPGASTEQGGVMPSFFLRSNGLGVCIPALHQNRVGGLTNGAA